MRVKKKKKDVDGRGGGPPPPPPATPPCVRVRTRRFETVTLAFLEYGRNAGWVFGSSHRPGRLSPFPSRLSGFTHQRRREVQFDLADACLAPASAPPDAGHRELPYGRARARWRCRMVRPLPKYAHRVSLLPGPALS